MNVIGDAVKKERTKKYLTKLIMSEKFTRREIAELVKISDGDSNVADKAIKLINNFESMSTSDLLEFAKISGGNYKVCMEIINLCKDRLNTYVIVELIKISNGDDRVCAAACNHLGISLL